jgi:hypothetical protein
VIETLTWMAVAPKKALKPEHIAILGAADDYGPPGPSTSGGWR